MKDVNIRLVSAGIGVTAVVAMGGLGAFGTAGPADADGTFIASMTTGQTVTSSTPAPEPSVSAAKPAVKGPAPLPSEEQGLPG